MPVRDPATGPGPMALRVASFNIRSARSFDGRNSWPLRRLATVGAIRGLDADVVGLQEVHRGPSAYLLRRLRSYAGVGDGRSGGKRGERCLVLHRTERLEMLAWSTRWFSDAPDRAGTRLPGASFPRVVTLVELADRRSGRRFGVADVHLDEHRNENRLASVHMLTSWLDPGLPWLVVGDFNAGPTSRVLAVLTDAGFRPALDHGAGGTAHGFTGRADGPRLDHILVSSHWDVLAGAAVRTEAGRLPSDHWPVVADVRLDADPFLP
ncbi:MAG TPA: endonuclease/exonuclease/phosphatase family protein [Acidimicrobiales bacterium]|nr:endonuclease/exonuclease/phosphatase family protein [Acidimicrobiales bacterium]